MTYIHMTEKERDKLAVYRSRGLSLRDIGHRLERSIGAPTIFRAFFVDWTWKEFFQHHRRKRLFNVKIGAKKTASSEKRPIILNPRQVYARSFPMEKSS